MCAVVGIKESDMHTVDKEAESAIKGNVQDAVFEATGVNINSHGVKITSAEGIKSTFSGKVVRYLLREIECGPPELGTSPPEEVIYSKELSEFRNANSQ